MTVLVDKQEYGKIPIDQDDERFFPFSREVHYLQAQICIWLSYVISLQFRLTLGVGAGGVNDFPDNYVSNPSKPWQNLDRKQIRDFFNSRSQWISTWTKSELRIDSVRIWAVWNERLRCIKTCNKYYSDNKIVFNKQPPLNSFEGCNQVLVGIWLLSRDYIGILGILCSHLHVS